VMKVKNVSDDFVVLDDLLHKDLRTPLRIRPGEEVDLSELCFLDEVPHSRKLREALTSGLLVCPNPVSELLRPPSDLDMDRVRREVKRTPILNLGVVFERGSCKLFLKCGECDEGLHMREDGWFCPKCGAFLEPLELVQTIKRLYMRLESLKKQAFLIERRRRGM